MDEYSILKKKRKKNAFAATSLLISIALALVVLVGAVLILGKVDNKELTTPNDDSNMTLGSSSEITCVGLTKEMIFNNNIGNIKEAAVSYFTNERLPKNIGDTVKITLKEMLNNKLVLNVIDSSYKLCDGDKSYVEVTKEENEYVMKVFLSCSDMEDYILVHLGCYDYCDKDVCEKKEETKEYEYEYKKTTSCVMTDWSNWGNWTLTRQQTSSLKKEDIKVEKSTKEVVDTKEATKVVTYNCDKYPGYTLVGDKCIKETSIKDVKDANKTVTYNCKKYSGYTLVGDKCIKETTKTDTKDATKKVASYNCDKYSGYTLVGDKCVKETKKTDTKDATPVYATKIVKESYTCYKTECTTKTVFMCPEGKTCGNYPQTSCEKVKKTCTRDKEEKYISKYTCPSDYTLDGTKCTKTTVEKDTKDATPKYKYTCPSGYTLDGTKCTKTTVETDTKDATPKYKYTCPKGYTLDGKKCTKTTVETDTQDATAKTKYDCNKYSGYTLVGDKCVKTSSSTDTKDASSKVKYTCPDGYTQNNNTCTKKSTKTITTTYYRYATRSCNGGSISIKWSTSKNDSILKSEGYKLTGNKRVLKTVEK